MGREALTQAEVGGQAGAVRAILESHELVLRGEIRRRYPKATIEQVVVDTDSLRFLSGGEIVRLHLGAKTALRWAAAIATPPPSVRVKLGLDKGARALLVGTIADAALADATHGSLVTDGAEARMIIALIDGPDSLLEALRVHTSFSALPLWTIHPRGSRVAFGETAIRTALRAAGFRDTKSCTISDRLSATRYHPG